MKRLFWFLFNQGPFPFLVIAIVLVNALSFQALLNAETELKSAIERSSIPAPSPTQSFTILPVTLTAYSPSIAQTDSTPFETASGQIVSPHDLGEQLFAAASRDLLVKFTPGAPLDFGSKIYLEITIIDTMHPRWTNRIDLFVRNKQIADLIGKQPNRNIIILEE